MAIPTPSKLAPPPITPNATTLFLKFGTILDIKENTTLLGSTKMEDYPKESREWYVVVVENASDVGITGGGVVDGHGLGFVKRFNMRKNVMCRPRLVGFIDCKNVRVWNITLTKPAYWCYSSRIGSLYVSYGGRCNVCCISMYLMNNLHIVRCKNTSIHDVSIYVNFNTPNNDGIDIEDSNNTVITRCHIDIGDDAIYPKTYTCPLYNLTVTNCWIRTKSLAIKLGNASSFDFKGLTLDNITIVQSHKGLGFQIRDGEPIYVTTCPRDSSAKEGSISNVVFINITANFENGVFLSGSKHGLLNNLRFKIVNLTYRRWTNYSGGLIDYRPGCQGLVNHSVAGIIMEHIKGLEVENVGMRWFDHQLGLGVESPLIFYTKK
ncbi:hypothetical protein ACB092_09G141800 [Castanea dentata]